MATVTELKNEWAEAVSAAGKLGDDKAAFDAAWTDAEAKRHKFENAQKVSDAEKSLGTPATEVQQMAESTRNNADASLIKTVDAATANTIPNGYVELAGKAIVPYASTTTEGWIKKMPVACQHPDILARLTPDMRAEKDLQERAFALYFRGGTNAVKRAVDAMGAEGSKLLRAFNALQEDTDSEGGFLVPTDQRFEVIRNPGVPGGVTRPISTVFTTTRDGGTWPTATSVTWAGIAEEESKADSDPAFNQVPFTIRKSGVNNRLSTELLGDSAVNIPSLLGVLYSESRGRYEDQQAIEGDGTTEPLGLRTTAAVQGAIADITDVWADPPTALEIIKAYFELPAQWRSRSTWHMTSSIFSKIVSVGSAAAGIHFVPDNQSLASGVAMTLLGRPVVFYDGTGWDDAATLSSGEEVGALGDFGQYYFIDRMGMSVYRDDSVYFNTDQVAFKARARYDSLFAIADAFRILKG